MYIMCVCLLSALSWRVGNLQISIIIWGPVKNCPLAYSFQRPMAYNQLWWWLEERCHKPVLGVWMCVCVMWPTHGGWHCSGTTTEWYQNRIKTETHSSFSLDFSFSLLKIDVWKSCGRWEWVCRYTICCTVCLWKEMPCTMFWLTQTIVCVCVCVRFLIILSINCFSRTALAMCV